MRDGVPSLVVFAQDSFIISLRVQVSRLLPSVLFLHGFGAFSASYVPLLGVHMKQGFSRGARSYHEPVRQPCPV